MSADCEDILVALERVIQSRAATAAADDSYVAQLLATRDAPSRKVGEEARELQQAAAAQNRDAIRAETADLWFHCMVLLAQHRVPVASVLQTLRERFGVSGLREKSMRAR